MDINNIKKQYTCLICQNIFLEPIKLTKCDHKMCSRCIKDYSSTQQQLNCPSCKTPFEITDIIPDENLIQRMMNIKVKCECNQIMTLFQYSMHCDICAANKNKFKNEEKAKDKNIEINNRHVFDYEIEKSHNDYEEPEKEMIASKETFCNIVNNDKENKLYDFEKKFLIAYLKSDLYFGKLFEKKVGKYFQSLIEQPRQKITFLISNKNPQNILMQSARIDLADCLLDYLENKFIVLNDSTGKEKIESRILTLEELKINQKDMFSELNKLMELIEDQESKNFIIANIGMNENIAGFIFSSRLFFQSELNRKSKKVKITMDINEEDTNKITYDFLDSNETVVFSTVVNKKIFGTQFGGIILIESNCWETS